MISEQCLASSPGAHLTTYFSLYQLALADQPKAAIFAYTEFKLLAAALFAVGSVLVVSSMWALGVTGTYLGDYFGILMDVSRLR